MNFLVETKKEYTIQLVNILTPLIYEGLQSIYGEAKNLSNQNDNNVLKIFQSFLKRIPKWNNEMIEKEKNRILNNSRSLSWLKDLIKATIKSNIILLTHIPGTNKVPFINPDLYQNVNLGNFIHKIYIECAREIWNNPYLFYHNYPGIELKRNQRDSITLVKGCIEEGIRKLLPVKHILELYLGDEMIKGKPDDNFDKSMSDIQSKNLSLLVKKDLENNLGNNINLSKEKLKESFVPVVYDNQQKGGAVKDKADKTVGSKILSILDKQNIRFSTESDSSDTDIDYSINHKKESVTSTIKKSFNKKLSDTSENVFKGDKINNDIDNKIKNILEKDLGDTDIETSLTYKDTDKPIDFYSNSETPRNHSTIQTAKTAKTKDSSESSKNTQEKKDNLNKQKFFNNYLNI